MMYENLTLPYITLHFLCYISQKPTLGSIFLSLSFSNFGTISLLLKRRIDRYIKLSFMLQILKEVFWKWNFI